MGGVDPSPVTDPGPPRVPLRVLLHAAGLAVALAFTVALTWLYLESEKSFYPWDYGVYQDLAVRIAGSFGTSFEKGVGAVAHSASEDYNAFFAVPLVPFLWVLGETRLAYELGLAVVYGLPFALAVGGVASLLVRGPRAFVFWSAAALTLLTPAAWVPLFRGFPDVGAAALVTLAVGACLRDPGLERRSTIVLVGGLLAAAVLFRRHFLFGASAVVATLALDAILERTALRKLPGRPRTDLVSAAARVLLVVGMGLAAGFVLSRPALLHLVSRDYYDLYEGYLYSGGAVARSWLEPHGWLAVVGALLGFVAGWRTGVLEPRRARFVLVVGVTSLVQWALIVRQLGEQYTLHLTPVVVLGLVSLGWTLWLRSEGVLHALVPAAALVHAVANLVFGLASFELTGAPVAFRSLLAENSPPRVRQDDVARLVATLRELATPEQPIYVAASSLTMSPSLLINAERELHGRAAARLNVQLVPAVDSRDKYPIEPLLRARFLVRVAPLQLHLPRDRQDVVSVVHDMFTHEIGMARDFEEVPLRFALREGAVATLFRRKRPTTLETGLATLRYVQERIPETLGSQPEWSIVNGPFPAWVEKGGDGATNFTWHPAPGDSAPTAVYLLPPPERVRVSGTFRFVDSRCAGTTLVFSYLGPDDVAVEAAKLARKPGEPGTFETSFFRGRSGRRLVARLRPLSPQSSIDYCLVDVLGLTVSPADAGERRRSSS
jgi:hypothetical protein